MILPGQGNVCSAASMHGNCHHTVVPQVLFCKLDYFSDPLPASEHWSHSLCVGDLAMLGYTVSLDTPSKKLRRCDCLIGLIGHAPCQPPACMATARHRLLSLQAPSIYAAQTELRSLIDSKTTPRSGTP